MRGSLTADSIEYLKNEAELAAPGRALPDLEAASTHRIEACFAIFGLHHSAIVGHFLRIQVPEDLILVGLP